MISHTEDRFWKAYGRLDRQMQKRARQAYRLFEKNPRHPSLHFKKVHATEPIYSVWVSLDDRVLGIRDGEEIVWFWIGPYDEYERLVGQM